MRVEGKWEWSDGEERRNGKGWLSNRLRGMWKDEGTG